jgi:hypothetical protein
MNANLSRWVRLHAVLEGSHAWSRAILLALRLYGVAALSFIWLVIHYGPAGRLRPLGAPILRPALGLGYVLCLSGLSVVGLKQLRSSARRKGLLNLGLAVLTGLLGGCAWHLLCLEAGRWH